MDFLEMFTDSDQFKTGDFEDDNLIKKELTKGDNFFRVVGKGRYYYVHRFDSANGVRVSSICVKDEEGEGECPVCQVWKGAWKVLNEVKKADDAGQNHDYNAEQIKKAKIICGEENVPGKNFKQSWGAKKHIALNVIDRDSNINQKEKHLSLLVKDGQYDKGITASKKSVYETMVKLLTKNKEEIKEHYKKGFAYLPFDVNITKEGKGIDTDYDKEKGESSLLTEEELSWEKYNLAEIVKPTDVKQVETWLKTGTKTSKKEDSGTDEFAEKADENPEKDLMPPDNSIAKTETKTETKKEDKTETKTETKEEPEKKAGGFKKKEGKQEETEKDKMDACPTCEKQIPTTSDKCEYCGEEFTSYEADGKPF